MIWNIKFHLRKGLFFLLALCTLLILINSTSNVFKITFKKWESTTSQFQLLENFLNKFINKEQDGVFTSHSDLDKNITLKEFFSVVHKSSSNVFFITPLQNPRILFRYLCAIECWAFNHPNANIWYIFTVTEIEDPGGLAKSLLKKYSNIKFIYSDVDKLMEDTPLYNFTVKKEWEKSKWPAVHLCDLMRQGVLWHKGGYYSDTDVYPIRSLINHRNFMCTAVGLYDGCLIHNDHHHPWNRAIMETIPTTFNPTMYFSAATTASMATAVRECGDKYGENVGKKERNCTVHGKMVTFQHENFLSSPFAAAFKPKKNQWYNEYLKAGAHAFHLGNSATRRKPATFGSQSLLDNFAKRNCPLIYNQVKKNTDFW